MTMGHRSLLFSVVLLVRTSTFCSWAFQLQVGPFATSTGRRRASTSNLFSTQTQIDVSTDAPRNYNSFVEWANYYGVAQENFQIGGSADNWGGVASQAAPAGSRVLYVPSMLRITSQAVREQEFAVASPMISRYVDATKPSSGDIDLASHFYLFLKVLQEYDRGDQSPYFSWLDALPRKFSTALTFDDFELECLPPYVKFLSEKHRLNYELFVQVLKQLDSPSISDATKTNSQVTKWAFNVVFTRARADAGEAEIIPMLDMINHAANPSVDLQYDDQGNAHVVLLRDVQAGEPLTKCYGQPTNPSRHMAIYGFFDPSPPSTYCKLLPGMIVTEQFKNLGFQEDRLVFFVEDGSISQEVWDVMLFIVLESIDTNAQQQFYQAHMNGDVDTKTQFHQHYMIYTITGLMEHVKSVLAELEDCARAMDRGGLGPAHHNLPMLQRHNEFVQQTFLKVKKYLEQLSSN